jgi:hypothetical protein
VIHRAALASFALLAAAALLQCSNKPSCDATSCAAGCCDATGTCARGDAIEACGAPGSGMCAVCGASQNCIDGLCQHIGAGGGGGGSGGGGAMMAGGGMAGTGGGFGGGLTDDCPDGGDGPCLNGICVDGVCIKDNTDSGTGGGGGGPFMGFFCGATRTVPVFSAPIDDAGYFFHNWMEMTVSDGGTYEALDLELYADLQANQPVPGVSDLDGGTANGDPTRDLNCGVCPLYFEGCDDTGLCAHTYLGISGRVDVQQVTQGAPGTAHATLSNVLLYEWNFADDKPVDDGGCIIVGSAVFDAGW